MLPGQLPDLLDLPFSKQAGRTELAKSENLAAGDLDADCLGKADGFVAARLDGAKARLPDAIRHHDESPLAATDPAFVGASKDAQPSSSGRCSPARFKGCPGCIVETACL